MKPIQYMRVYEFNAITWKLYWITSMPIVKLSFDLPLPLGNVLRCHFVAAKCPKTVGYFDNTQHYYLCSPLRPTKTGLRIRLLALLPQLGPISAMSRHRATSWRQPLTARYINGYCAMYVFGPLFRVDRSRAWKGHTRIIYKYIYTYIYIYSSQGN